jgi:hypothetical protein
VSTWAVSTPNSKAVGGSLLWWCWLSCQESSLSSRLADMQKRTGGWRQVLGNKPACDTSSSQSVGAICSLAALHKPIPIPTPELLLLHACQPRRSCMRRRSHRMRPPPPPSASPSPSPSPHTLKSTAGCSVSHPVICPSNSKHVGADLIQCSCTHSITPSPPHPLTHSPTHSRYHACALSGAPTYSSHAAGIHPPWLLLVVEEPLVAHNVRLDPDSPTRGSTARV